MRKKSQKSENGHTQVRIAEGDNSFDSHACVIHSYLFMHDQ